MAVAGYLLRGRERMRAHAALVPFRVAILRSFTVEPLVPLLSAGALAGGLDLDVHVGGFNAYAQEILDAGSALYRHPAADGDPGASTDRARRDFRGPGSGGVPRALRRVPRHPRPGRAGGTRGQRGAAAAGRGASRRLRAAVRRSGRARHGADARNQAAMGMPLANDALAPPGAALARLRPSPRRAGLQGAGHRPRQHAVGRRARRGRPRGHRGPSRAAAGAARAPPPRHPARGVQQERRGGRAGRPRPSRGVVLRPEHFSAPASTGATSHRTCARSRPSSPSASTRSRTWTTTPWSWSACAASCPR